MSSINTNIAAMTALKSLQMTNASLEKTQNAISTGYRVANSKDNAAYWSIATTMRSDNKALSTVQDALGLGAAKLDTTYTGLNAAIDVVDEIKAKLVAAREPGVDKAKVQAEISELQNNLVSIATAASFSGENWLSVDSGATDYSSTKEVVASFNRASDGTVSVGTISIDITSTELFDADDQSGILDTEITTTGAGAVTVSVATLDITATDIDDTDIDQLISHVDSALQDMTTAAADIGSAAKRVDLQNDFVGDLMDAIDRGIGQLVDADMSEESTKLQALQTQQQLGIQALAIANSGAQSILSLFR
ncbi:MAG: flagellin [Nitratireductor sp.]